MYLTNYPQSKVTFDVKPGDYAQKTHDCFTRPGCVQLLHDSEEQAELDLEAGIDPLIFIFICLIYLFIYLVFY
jgi:hypothetical protein